MLLRVVTSITSKRLMEPTCLGSNSQATPYYAYPALIVHKIHYNTLVNVGSALPGLM